jgi:DNA-binding beta-propeller fold protein YncE
MRTASFRSLRLSLLLTAISMASATLAQIVGQPLPTGQRLTPLAAPGARFDPLIARVGLNPRFVADGAAAIATSPNGREMLVMTSGFNRYNGQDGKIVPAQSVQYIFRYAINAHGSRWLQTLTVPNSYGGIAWLPGGAGFVVGGGVDDNVHLFQPGKTGFVESAKPVALGHAAGNGADVKPQAAGVAISPDGARALVANYYNDSVSLIDLKQGTVIAEQDLRPGKINPAMAGTPGGENPFAVLWTDPTHAWISTPRDRQIVRVEIAARSVRVVARVATLGEPTALVADAATRRLYATEDNADRLAIIDLVTGRLLGEPRLGLPETMAAAPLAKGVNPNAIALLPDHRLLITLGGINAVALVATQDDGDATVQGLVPTGWYPSALAISRDGARIFVANRKSPPGPNPNGCAPALTIYRAQPNACGSANQYIYQLEKAGLLQFPMPSARALVRTTLQVADNIGLSDSKRRANAEARMAAVRARIKHVVFIIKENRTYDQVLGDLEVGNGDPHLAILGKQLSPNHHAIARQFVTLDNFYASGEQSSTGWTWSTAARVPDLLEKTAPVNYARRGLAYEAEEADRFVYTQQTMAERHATNPKLSTDPDLMPGPALLTAPDGDKDDEQNQGYLWDAALRAGLSVRNYGFADASIYDAGTPGAVPLVREPAKTNTRIYTPGDHLLAPHSDPYFRGFDQKMPDYWRTLEWQREFAAANASGNVPALTLLRLSHDHFGDFNDAIDGVNTVETEMADNDYSVGLVMETIAHSKVSGSTLVFVIEDDAQNGADHVDARRSVALVVGPMVKQHALITTRYTTINILRTIEAVLGLSPLGLNDSLAAPMADIFDPALTDWTYTASAADVLRTTQLPIPAGRFAPHLTHAGCEPRNAAYWNTAMEGQDFSSEDRLATDRFNAALWQGLGRGPLPLSRSGADMRHNRAAYIDAEAALANCGFAGR